MWKAYSNDSQIHAVEHILEVSQFQFTEKHEIEKNWLIKKFFLKSLL